MICYLKALIRPVFWAEEGKGELTCSFNNRKKAHIPGTWRPMPQRVSEMGLRRQVAETTPDLLARVLGLDFVLKAMGNFRVMRGVLSGEVKQFPVHFF